VSPALRILFVGVSSSEADSVVRALEAAGYTLTWRLLPDLAAVSGALAAAPWDAVISATPAAALEAPRTSSAGELPAALAAQRDAMRTLSVRLSEVEENARRRLSAELHDRVGQSLVSLGLTLSLVRYQLAASGADALVARIDEALSVTDGMATQVRDVMVELRPPVLDDFGLLAALRSHGVIFAKTTGLAAEVLGEEPSPRMPLIVETALFRVAQEALTNVVRHAHARRVTLTLQPMPDCVRLTLADDGQGFSPQRPRGIGERPRWGLIAMRERVETVGGTMRIVSAPGEGTSIILEVGR
jgi:two-component system sensor histidine kinase UhpB